MEKHTGLARAPSPFPLPPAGPEGLWLGGRERGSVRGRGGLEGRRGRGQARYSAARTACHLAAIVILSVAKELSEQAIP